MLWPRGLSSLPLHIEVRVMRWQYGSNKDTGARLQGVVEGAPTGAPCAEEGLISDVSLLLIIISCTQTLLNTENADSNHFTSIALAPPLVRRPYASHIVHTHFLRHWVPLGQEHSVAQPPTSGTLCFMISNTPVPLSPSNLTWKLIYSAKPTPFKSVAFLGLEWTHRFSLVYCFIMLLLLFATMDVWFCKVTLSVKKSAHK